MCVCVCVCVYVYVCVDSFCIVGWWSGWESLLTRVAPALSSQAPSVAARGAKHAVLCGRSWCVLAQVTRDNEQVAQCFGSSIVSGLVKGFESDHHDHRCLVALQRCMTVNGAPIVENQDRVMRALLAPSLPSSRLLLVNDDSGAELALPPLLQSLVVPTDWSRVNVAVDGDASSSQGVTRAQQAPLAFVDLLATASLGENPLAIDMCQAQLKRGAVVAAVVKSQVEHGMRIKVCAARRRCASALLAEELLDASQHVAERPWYCGGVCVPNGWCCRARWCRCSTVCGSLAANATTSSTGTAGVSCTASWPT